MVSFNMYIYESKSLYMIQCILHIYMYYLQVIHSVANDVLYYRWPHRQTNMSQENIRQIKPKSGPQICPESGSQFDVTSCRLA